MDAPYIYLAIVLFLFYLFLYFLEQLCRKKNQPHGQHTPLPNNLIHIRNHLEPIRVLSVPSVDIEEPQSEQLANTTILVLPQTTYRQESNDSSELPSYEEAIKKINKN